MHVATKLDMVGWHVLLACMPCMHVMHAPLACTSHADTSSLSAGTVAPLHHGMHQTLACSPCAPLACTCNTDTSTFLACPVHTDIVIQACLQDVPWVEGRLQEIVGIIPDLAGKIDRMKANIIIQLVTDTQVSLRFRYFLSNFTASYA